MTSCTTGIRRVVQLVTYKLCNPVHRIILTFHTKHYGTHLFSQKEKVQNSRRDQRTLFCHPAETSEKRWQERRRPCRNPFGKQFTKQRGSIEHPHRSAGRDRRDIEKWRIRIHQRLGRFMPPTSMDSSIRKMYCLTRYGYPKYISLADRKLPNVSAGMKFFSLPTIQIFPKGLVTTRNNQGRRDSGRGTGVHS